MAPFANQSHSLIALQYELALLIGQDLRLGPMLRRFFPPTLKLLGCRAAHVWLREQADGVPAHRFSYPSHDARCLGGDCPLKDTIEKYSSDFSAPLVVSLGEDGWAHFIPLRRLGFCVLVRAGKPLGAEVRAALNPIFDRLATACAACMEHEFTESLRVSAAENEQRLRSVFESVGEVIFQLDEYGRVESLNPAWTRITGLPTQDSIGRQLVDLLITDHDNMANLVRLMLTGSNDPLAFDAQVRTLDDRFRNVSVQIKRAQVRGEDGSRLIGTMVDTTEQHAMIDRLIHARARAEKASQAKSAFLANMSHEIRTPMNGVIGLAEVALNDTKEPETRDHLEMILASAEHLLTIINDILDFSRIEAGQIAFKESEFDLHALVAQTIAQMRLPIESKGLKFSFEMDERLPRIVEGDAVRLKQVLLNLIGNALKFTQEGGISVRIRPAGDGLVRFEVEDTGIGVPLDKQQHIFTAFSQADESIIRSYGGTGLGLTICSRLVEMMNGTIGLESTPGIGSRFWFTARLGGTVARSSAPSADQASGRPAASPATVPSHGKLRILVAEDHVINRRLMEAMLRQMGHEAVFAENGQQAVSSRAESEFDLVLMDMQMPVMDGLCATRAIRKFESLSGVRPVPVYALTANAMDSDRDACVAAGMNGHLAKPIKRAALEEVLAQVAARNQDHPAHEHRIASR